LIFVEGIRLVGNALSNALGGVGGVAMESGVPIVAVYVKGADQVMAPGAKFLKRGPVSATFGESFYVNDASSYEEASQRILDKIYALA